jgi:hypothetical protein
MTSSPSSWWASEFRRIVARDCLHCLRQLLTRGGRLQVARRIPRCTPLLRVNSMANARLNLSMLFLDRTSSRAILVQLPMFPSRFPMCLSPLCGARSIASEQR